jgi:hypothetical protein
LSSDLKRVDARLYREPPTDSIGERAADAAIDRRGKPNFLSSWPLIRRRFYKKDQSRGARRMTTQFDDVVKDDKQLAKDEIAGYLERRDGSFTVIDKLIKAVCDIHQNKPLDETTVQQLLVLLSCIERLRDDLLTWTQTR